MPYGTTDYLLPMCIMDNIRMSCWWLSKCCITLWRTIFKKVAYMGPVICCSSQKVKGDICTGFLKRIGLQIVYLHDQILEFQELKLVGKGVEKEYCSPHKSVMLTSGSDWNQ